MWRLLRFARNDGGWGANDDWFSVTVCPMEPGISVMKAHWFLLAAGLLAAGAAAGAACPPAATTPVHAVAGQGAAPVAEGERVTVDGVVTGAFLGREALNGFYLQGAEPAPDGKPSGLFVYAPTLDGDDAARVVPGRLLRLRGRAGAFRGRPQLEWLESVTDCGPAEVTAHPVAAPWRFNARHEGLHVTFTDPLTVTGNYELDRHGTLRLAAGGRAFRPTNFHPGDGPSDPRRRGGRIILDDGSPRWGPDPIPYLDGDGTRRVGSTAEEITGVVTHAFGDWRVHPTRPPHFRNTRPRPDPLPPPPPEAVRVAAFNVENYFLTLGGRGAETARQLERQRAKLLAAAGELDADILALVEMENRPEAVEDFAARLAAATGRPWRPIRAGDAGTDAIRVSLVYRADRVAPTGAVARDGDAVHHRPPLLAGFRPLDEGAAFAVAAVHFKAKSGCPETGDVDRGQGCWNRRRVEQAEALTRFIGRWREAHGLPVLVAGDLNAYGAEDPVAVLTASGKIDLLAAHVPWERRYTYVFHGESGYLDYLLAPAALAERVIAVHTHPINADDPRFLQYDDGGPGGRYYAPDPYRSSDHDPVAVDLSTGSPGHPAP